MRREWRRPVYNRIMKIPIGVLVENLTVLRDALPDLEFDPAGWGTAGMQLLSAMATTGPLFREAASYLLRNGIPLYETREARGVGAGWHEDFRGRRWISVDTRLGSADRMIGIAHEACHLRQSVRKRCSVEGEYEAWRLGYALRCELAARGIPVPALSEDERKLEAMPDRPTADDLREARRLMKKIASPGYPIDRAALQGEYWSTAVLAFGVRIINTLQTRGERL
jgi:hypothetical protein